MDKIMGFLPFMLECTVVTVEIFVLTLVISLPLGLPVALGSNSRIKPLSILCKTYVWIFRGTPLLLQLFFFYYFFPLVLDMPGMSVFVTVLLTFVLNLFMFDGTVLWHRSVRGGPFAGTFQETDYDGYNNAPDYEGYPASCSQ